MSWSITIIDRRHDEDIISLHRIPKYKKTELCDLSSIQWLILINDIHGDLKQSLWTWRTTQNPNRVVRIIGISRVCRMAMFTWWSQSLHKPNVHQHYQSSCWVHDLLFQDRQCQRESKEKAQLLHSTSSCLYAYRT